MQKYYNIIENYIRRSKIMALDRKTISISMPQELYDLMLKLRNDHMKGKTGNSEIVWECIKIAAAYHYNWVNFEGDLELTDPEVNEAEEIIRRYEINKTRHLRSNKGGGRKKSNDTLVKKEVKRKLQGSPEPLALTDLTREGLSRRRIKRVIEQLEEKKQIVVHRPVEVGKAWSIALIGTEAEQRVNKLNRVEDNTERINKRRKPKKRKKRVRKTKGDK